MGIIFFFKQRTAYEMRISDWGADVCSSDLPSGGRISSGYGMRRHPILGYKRMHAGVDFAGGYGAPIHAATEDRKSVVSGKSVSVRVDPGGRRIIKKKKEIEPTIARRASYNLINSQHQHQIQTTEQYT